MNSKKKSRQERALKRLLESLEEINKKMAKPFTSEAAHSFFDILLGEKSKNPIPSDAAATAWNLNRQRNAAIHQIETLSKALGEPLSAGWMCKGLGYFITSVNGRL